MAEISADALEMTKNKLIELNNNSQSSPDLPDSNNLQKATVVVKNIVSDSSVESFSSKLGRQHSLKDLFKRNNSETKIPTFHRTRSNSDGAASILKNANAVPSLPNAVMEKMGLNGDLTPDGFTEDVFEQKFTSLALAFTIDATTIKDRCERQRRARDQTESNFNLEVDKLKEKLTLLQPLCTDLERAELLSILFAQVETLMKAASLVSNAAERYGAAQHEEKLTSSVQLMVNHVQGLKQQRDSARRQLQYTKRVLQEPIASVPSPTSQKSIGNSNKKVISRRRASVDSVNLSLQDQNSKLNRRISDLSFRASLAKTSRPSRLELNLELNKIKEISLDDASKDQLSKETPETTPIQDVSMGDFDFNVKTEQQKGVRVCHTCDDMVGKMGSLLRAKLSTMSEVVQKMLRDVLTKWSENGYMHAFLNSCAVLCFSVSILTLVSIFLEQDFSRSPSFWRFSWVNRKK